MFDKDLSEESSSQEVSESESEQDQKEVLK